MVLSSLERSTAPQSEYTARQLVVGAIVLILGLVVAFVIPIVLG